MAAHSWLEGASASTVSLGWPTYLPTGLAVGQGATAAGGGLPPAATAVGGGGRVVSPAHPLVIKYTSDKIYQCCQ